MTQNGNWRDPKAREALVDDLYKHGYLGYAPTASLEDIAEQHGVVPHVAREVLKTERGREARGRPYLDPKLKTAILALVVQWTEQGQGERVQALRQLCEVMEWEVLDEIVAALYKAEAP